MRSSPQRKLRNKITGLERLNSQPLPPRGAQKQKKTDKYVYEPGTVLGNYLYLARKEKGVEPGFFAVEVNANLVKRINQIFKENMQDVENLERWFLYLDVMKEMEPDEYNRIIKILVKELYKNAKKGYVPEGQIKIDLLLFKQDYDEPGMWGVKPDKENLSQTNYIKKQQKHFRGLFTELYGLGRSESPTEANINGNLECFAVRFAGRYGMETNIMQVVLGRYLNGYPKVMPVCVWDPKVQGLEGCIDGSQVESDYENYFVRVERQEKNSPVKIKSNNGKYYISDSAIRDTGESLALFILQGCYDCLGSTLQNKGVKKGRLFGYDFGHAHRGKSVLLEAKQHLQDDFSFTQPTQSKNKFKNLSACYDTPMVNRMAGLFFLYKMMEKSLRDLHFSSGEQKNIEIAINHYREKYPWFEKRYQEASAECIEEMFSDYYLKFVELAVNATDTLLTNEYLVYANSIQEAWSNTLHDLGKMFEIFKRKMQLSPVEVELLDNLEKLTSTTSLTSDNQKVILSHLRIINNKIRWKFLIDENLSLSLVAILNKDNAQHVYRVIKEYLSQFDGHENIPVLLRGNRIEIILADDPREMKVQLLAEMLDEKNIILFKCKKGLIKRELLEEHPTHAKLLVGDARENEKGREKEKEKEEAVSDHVHKKSIYQNDRVGLLFSTSSEAVMADEQFDCFTGSEIGIIMQPLLVYLVQADTFVDMEKRQVKMQSVKECIANILSGTFKRDDIVIHLSTLKNQDFVLDKDKPNRLKTALNETAARMESIYNMKKTSAGFKSIS